MSAKPTIVIADDHPVYLIGLQQVIGQTGEFDLIGTAGNGLDALDLIRQKQPDVALLDIDMPRMNAIRISENIRAEQIKTKVIAITVNKDEILFNQALEAGIHGYLLKENSVIDLLESIRTVLQGNFFFSSSVSSFLINRNARPAEQDRKSRKLTKTEKKVMKMIAEGSTSMEIAGKMKSSVKTINNHRANICKKLNLKGTNSLLVYAMKNKEMYVNYA